MLVLDRACAQSSRAVESRAKRDGSNTDPWRINQSTTVNQSLESSVWDDPRFYSIRSCPLVPHQGRDDRPGFPSGLPVIPVDAPAGWNVCPCSSPAALHHHLNCKHTDPLMDERWRSIRIQTMWPMMKLHSWVLIKYIRWPPLLDSSRGHPHAQSCHFSFQSDPPFFLLFSCSSNH